MGVPPVQVWIASNDNPDSFETLTRESRPYFLRGAKRCGTGGTPILRWIVQLHASLLSLKG